jgi:ABC-type branched-subunit amino acid transport system ATPase component
VTIVLIEPIMPAVFGLANRIIVSPHGEKIAEGSSAEEVCGPMAVEAYFGEPPAVFGTV